MPIPNRAVAFAAAVLTLAFAASGVQAYQCKTSFVQAESLGNPKVKAQKSAKTIWASSVKGSLGLQWSSWDIAASKSMNCNWTGAKFYCIAKAKPCLYVVP
ncbi:MAG: hypothetical protein AB7F74_24090 [Parvibaculaceae bacterium]